MKIIILAGSESDSWHTDLIENALKEVSLDYETHFKSAHKDPRGVLDIVDSYKNDKVIFVTVAGMSNALSGVVACNCLKPVIACPPFKDKIDFSVNINSTLQMPSKTPVMTILSAKNVALSCKRIADLV